MMGGDATEPVAAAPKKMRPAGSAARRRDMVRFSMEGMHCAGCAETVKEVLRDQPGVRDAEVSFASEQGWVRYDPSVANLAAVLGSLEEYGYHAQLFSEPAEREIERRQDRMLLQLVVALGLGMQVMLLYIALLYPSYGVGDWSSSATRGAQYAAWVLATPILFFSGQSFLRGAWAALRARTASMDTLVALGTLSAYSYSVYRALTGTGHVYFDSVAMITSLILLGRYIEQLGGGEARKGIRNLLKLQPDLAWKRVSREPPQAQAPGSAGRGLPQAQAPGSAGEEWQQVQAEALAPGDEILIKPGERVPADAIILTGTADVDEALLTGESVPVTREPGAEVWAGTVVTDAALTARVSQELGDTRLARITRMVEEALSIKPPIQRMADRVSAYFALGIVILAVATFVAWWLRGAAVDQALLTGVSVLVVACPCSLGLATPLALAVTLGRTSRAGILVRNPTALETAATVNRVVLDKTGTLTQGHLAVTDTVTADGMAAPELLCLAAAVEQYSEHPVARAIGQACSSPVQQAEDFRVVAGRGVTARLPGQGKEQIQVGSPALLEAPPPAGLAAKAEAHAGKGETTVWVARGKETLGFIALRDEPNPTAEKALQQLNQEQVQPVMVSGDTFATVQAIAEELGLSDFAGQSSPAEKTRRIREWQKEGERVAMVGDGVNDAPALAQSDLSITVAGGTDVAGETSDVILTRPDLELIPWFINLSRRTRTIIRENLVWAFAYNAVALPLAALGRISPVVAAATMATSSLLVVANSLRLRR